MPNPIPTGEIFVRDFGDTSITALWAPITGATVYFLSIQPPHADSNQETFVEGDPLEFTFTGLAQGTEYTIQVVANSGGGQQDFSTTQITNPGKPGTISTVSKTSTSIDISFVPAPGSFDRYAIFYIDPSGSRNLAGETADQVFTIDLLFPGTTYDIEVETVVGTNGNELRSLPSEYTETTLPAAEGVLIISDCTTTTIEILWAKPNDPDVQQYIVSLLRLDGSTAIVQTIPVGTTPTPVYTIGDIPGQALIPGREYHISVAFAGTTTVLTAIQRTKPTQPGTLRVIESTSSSIEVSWSPASNDYTGYCISYSTVGSALEIQAGTVYSPTTTFLIDGLDPSTGYVIYVRTKSGCGSSATVSVPRTVNVLTRAELLDIIFSSDNFITVDWTNVPSSSSNYRLELEQNGVVINDQTKTVTRQNSANYIYRENLNLPEPSSFYTVRLYTVSPRQERDNVLFRAAPSSPPSTSLQTTNVMHNNLRVVWEAPDTGSFDGYIIEYDPDNGQIESGTELPKDQTSITLTGLTPNIEYTVRVRTFVGYNGNMRTSSASATTVSTGIGEAGKLTINNCDTDTLTVSWTDQSSFNGNTIIDFQLQYLPLGTPQTFTRNSRLAVFTGLTPGRSYTLILRGRTGAGTLELDRIVQTTAPAPPENFARTASSAYSLTFDWDVPVGDSTSLK
ncbi:tenascin-R-like [Amphiura filiformis]|uniref:tenascin-R-like n=1 Tax=Amphiura filiformis TaxID=82378 RepID=UPI003B22146A